MLNNRLNIFYLILERMNGFAEDAKFDITNGPGSQIATDYEQQRTDAWSEIENLNIAKRIISSGMFKPLRQLQCLQSKCREIGSSSASEWRGFGFGFTDKFTFPSTIPFIFVRLFQEKPTSTSKRIDRCASSIYSFRERRLSSFNEEGTASAAAS